MDHGDILINNRVVFEEKRKHININLYIMVVLFMVLCMFVTRVEEVVLFILFLLELLGIVFAIKKRMKFDIRLLSLLDKIMFFIGIVALLKILLYAFGIYIGYNKEFDVEFLMIDLVLMYFLIAFLGEFRYILFIEVVHATFLIDFLCIIKYFLFPDISGILVDFMNNSNQVASIAMLSALVGSLIYSFNNEKSMDVVYLVETVVAFSVLAINHNVISLYLFGIILFLSCAIIPVRYNSFKRLLTLFLIYAILICNMPLIIEYTTMIQVECVGYSLELGVLEELALILFGLYVANVWEKLPSYAYDQQIFNIQKYQKRFIYICITIVLMLISVVFIGSSVHNLQGGYLLDSVKNEIIAIQQSVSASAENEILYKAYSEYGLFGIVMLILLIIAVIDGVVQVRRIDSVSKNGNIVFLITILFICQLLFMGITASTSIIYCYFVSFFLTYRFGGENVK